MGGAVEMMTCYKEQTTPVGSKEKKENPALIERGVFVKKDTPEYVSEYDKIIDMAKAALKYAIRAVDYARAAGFDNIGLDLIFGLPGEDKKSLEANLEQALTFHPEHLSCYMLTYEPGTPLFNMRKTGKIVVLEEETVGDLYDFLSEFIENRLYGPYKISNFAKISNNLSNFVNFRSKHNQKYWRHAPYIGLGPAAHSFIRPKRFWNVRSLAGYIEALAEERSPVMEEEILSLEQERMEAVSLKAAGYLLYDDERLWLTRNIFWLMVHF